jgi:3'(2'), 5'-bisphosphate nucleotidase
MKKKDEFSILEVNRIAVEAGKAILSVYQTDFTDTIALKDDRSPLTLADLSSHRVILEGLQGLSDLPVLSEESHVPDVETRRAIRKYWLVDPLDGTKEFIKRNGEFTVNIALIEEGRPVWGSVYVPVSDELFWAEAGKGAFVSRNGQVEKLTVNTFSMDQPGLRVVASRSFLNPETRDYIGRFHEPELVSKGSSLKLLLLAEGKADFYPRLGPTMEWDIAAAQIILEEAGGRVLQLDTHEPLRYNKENLLNPHFIALGKTELA